MKKIILITGAALFFFACNNAGDPGTLSSDSMQYKMCRGLQALCKRVHEYVV